MKFRHRTLLLALAFAACKGEAGSTASARTTGAAGGDRGAVKMTSAGEVVIGPQSGQYQVQPVSAGAKVAGRVRFDSPPTPAAPVNAGDAASLCGPTVPDSSVQSSATGVAGAVVWLEGIRTGNAPGEERRIELESDRCRLIPRVQAVAAPATVNVLGHDTFEQRLHFAVGGEKGARDVVGLWGSEQVVPTDKATRAPGLVEVRDEKHPWIAAWIAVFDHPYWAVTGADGSYTIDGVPPGTYTLVAWHERSKRTETQVTVSAGGAITQDVALKAK